MKITTNEGQEMELVATDYRIGEDDSFQPLYALKPLKPVKKTEKKENYCVDLHHTSDLNNVGAILHLPLDLTPTTAHKLSEVISALVEYGTEDLEEENTKAIYYPDKLAKAAQAFRKSFKESQ